MTVYLIEVNDGGDGRGVECPTIVGPFRDEAQAREFSAAWQMGQPDSWEGGYGACHVICDATVDYSPEDYAAQFAGDEEDTA